MLYVPTTWFFLKITDRIPSESFTNGSITDNIQIYIKSNNIKKSSLEFLLFNDSYTEKPKVIKRSFIISCNNWDEEDW